MRTLISNGVRRFRAREVLATPGRRLSGRTNRTRPPALGGAVTSLDTTALQRVARTTRAPAFRIALIAGLSIAWIGTGILPDHAVGPASHPTRVQTHVPSDAAVLPEDSAGFAGEAESSDPLPGPAPVEVSVEFMRNFTSVAAKLDEQADREGFSRPLEPAVPLAHCSGCAASALPGPGQSSAAPEAPVAEPLVPPLPTAVEEPAPQQPAANLDPAVSLPADQLPTELPPAGSTVEGLHGQATNSAG